MKQLFQSINEILNKTTRTKKWLTALMVLVVFVTTYILILPAFTLTQEKAEQQGGIDIPAMEMAAEEAADEEAGSVDSENEAKIEAKTADKAKSENKAETTNDYAGEAVALTDPLTFEGEGFTIAVDDKKSVLPEDTEVVASELVEKPEEGTKAEKKEAEEAYRKYYELAQQAVKEEDGADDTRSISFVKFYDISLQAAGEVVQPDKPVDVTISYDEDQQKELKVDEKKNVRIIHFAEDQETGEITAELLKEDTIDVSLEQEKMAETTFEAESFSVYGVIYTVDFSYEVDGKSYEYSIKGGEGIGLSELLPALGVIKDDKDTDVNEVSEFISQIETVKFSDENLVSVSKADKETTVGGIKDALGLECEYSAELSDEQKEEINSKAIKAGDWALISLKAFDTEETLTITMKNGETFEVKVTDAHEITSSEATEIDINKAYMICYDDGVNYHILHNDGSQSSVSKGAFDILAEYYTSENTWAFQYVFKEYDREGTEGYNYYLIRSNDDISSTLAIYEEVTDSKDLIHSSNNNIAVLPAEGGGFYLSGYNGYRLAFENGKFISKKYNEGDPDTGSVMHIFERDTLPQYMLTVSSNDPSRGVVTIYNPSSVEDSDRLPADLDLDGQHITEVYKKFDILSDSPSSGTERHIDQIIYALPFGEPGNNNTNKYKFDHWALNGERLDPTEYPWRIPANSLPVPYNGSNLVAHFVYDDTFQPTDDQKTDSPVEDMSEWLDEFQSNRVPLDDSQTHKTAEVYDYENRIYRVDLTTKSNLRTFDGSIDLGFSLDVSNSMKFPADLQPYTNLSSVNLRYANSRNLGLDTSKTYYIISDRKNRSTVFKIFYRDNRWRYTDASKNDNNEITTSTTFHAIPEDGNDNNFIYQMYYANPDSTGVVRDRFYYLNQSITSITNDLINIKDTLNVAGAASPNVKVGYNTFNGYVQNGQLEHLNNGEWQRQQNDRRVLSDVARITPTFQNVAGGGTRPDRAIDDAKSLGWTGNTRYLILITDGAPQGGNRYRESETLAEIRQDVRDRAEEIKKSAAEGGQNVKIITIGLSMKDVEEGRKLLYDIADYAPNNGPKMFYLAEKTQDLTNILRQILDLILVDATVEGDITDTVNEAFYLVDKATGLPLQANDTIDINGNKTTDPAKVAGTVLADGKTVKWNDQTIDHRNGWHGVVYVKAKEDLIGANAVKTNDPENPAEFLAEKYYTSNNTTRKEFDENERDKLVTRVISKDSPRVNVNELTFPKTDTEWTVYLGTEVDPKKQLQQLYERITVKQVINEDCSLYYPLLENSITDDRESDDLGTPQTFQLAPVILDIIRNDPALNAKYIKNGALDWDKFLPDIMTGEGVAVPYHPYGIEGEDSKIVISLKPEILEGEETDLAGKSPHNTTVVNGTTTDDTGKIVDVPAEKYVLTVKYSPDYNNVLPKGQGGTSTEEFHTGAYGTGYQGHAAGTETSTNTHIINVFVKGLQITKTDLEGNTLTGAKFGLYRTAREGETPVDPTPEGLEGSYVKVADIDTSGSGTASLEEIESLGTDEKYYLVETQTPAGYNTMTPAEVSLTITDKYTTLPDGTEQGTKPATEPYNWTQTATLALTGANIERVDENGSVYSASTSDETDPAIYYYKIANNPGVVLPHTGGIGTTIFYILGSLLVIGSTIVLISRRRIRK